MLAICATIGAQTLKQMVVVDENGNRSTFPLTEIEGVLFEEAPEYIETSHLLSLRYEEKDDLGVYTIDLGTGAPDNGGDPAKIGDIQISLKLCAPKSASLISPELPVGYYLPGSGKAEYTFDVAKSAVWQRISEGSDGVAPTMIVDGTVDVKVDENGIYDLRMELTTLGGPLDLRYTGKLPFAGGYSDYMTFDQDLNLSFDGLKGRFYGNWYYPFAADMLLDFTCAGIGDDSGDTYHLYLDFCEPKPENPMNPTQRVADGVYTVDRREKVTDGMYLPFKFNAGSRVDFMGTEYITRTRLECVKADGRRYLGLITDGQFTVSENGGVFDFDLRTADGKAVRGSFSRLTASSYEMKNFCDNETSEPKRPYSTLTSNHTLNWKPGTSAFSFNDGNTILEDAYTLLVIISVPNMDKGDYLMFTLLSESDRLKAGIYPVDSTLAAGHAVPGTVEFGGTPIFSWYGDLDSTDADGYQDTLGPIASGAFTVTESTDGTMQITFSLKDDAGHDITGVFDGMYFNLSDQSWDAPAHKIKVRKF